MNKEPDDGVLARIDAINILHRWMETEDFPDRMMISVPPFRRGFVMDLVYTTIRHLRAMDFVLEEFVRRPPGTTAMAALLMGTCQLLKMQDVAEHAAIHATVEALREIAGDQQVGFANAVLRSIQRNAEKIMISLEAAPLAVRESHLDEQVQRWESFYGKERAEAICKWDNTSGCVTVVTLPRGPGVKKLLSMFQENDIQATAHPGMPDRAINIPHGSQVEKLPGFDKGYFLIQDPATLEAVRLLDVRPGHRVLDACAAPGGKSVQIGLLLNGRGKLVCMDCWEDRLIPLKENLHKFNLIDTTAEVVLGDARKIHLKHVGGKLFDRILVDAPCSNTGVQRRRVDAKWRFSADRLKTLAETQSDILRNVSRLLADNGKLVYSTCSLEKEENEDIVQDFLKTHRQFVLRDSTALVPPDGEMDGAYAAVLQKSIERR
ncbi:MAG: hypothetical protein GX804_11765 [Lentisphaerae bacterium]|jgi:16S rRNA (cytosine967-C5)-methyltransferase|nr:hypothetical protein [Lentisphaerota bacterium]